MFNRPSLWFIQYLYGIYCIDRLRAVKNNALLYPGSRLAIQYFFFRGTGHSVPKAIDMARGPSKGKSQVQVIELLAIFKAAEAANDALQKNSKLNRLELAKEEYGACSMAGASGC